MNAPFFVPTRTRTLLMRFSFVSALSKAYPCDDSAPKECSVHARRKNRRAANGTTRVGQLPAMTDVVHCDHQERLPSGPERPFQSPRRRLGRFVEARLANLIEERQI